jgi:hypothetical protein
MSSIVCAQNNTYNSSNFIRYQTLMKTSIDQVMLHHQGLYHGWWLPAQLGQHMHFAMHLRLIDKGCVCVCVWRGQPL